MAGGAAAANTPSAALKGVGYAEGRKALSGGAQTDDTVWVPPGPVPPRPEKLDATEGAHEGHDHGAERTHAPADPAKESAAGGGTAAAAMTGIGSKLAVGRFVAAAKKVQKDWNTLTPAQRATGLTDAANTELANVGVTKTTPEVADVGTFAAVFSFSTWKLKLGKPRFEVAAISDAQATAAADDVYHESRHAEQWFRMGRLLAGKGKTATQIKTELGIPAAAAADAKKAPLTADGGEKTEAQSWYDSVYGANAAHRVAVFAARERLRPPYVAASAEYDRVVANPRSTAKQKSDAYAAYLAAYNAYQDGYYKKYRALPEEADAWKLGDSVSTAYKKP